jgi:hypothetical protein
MAMNSVKSRKRAWPWLLVAAVVVIVGGGSLWGVFGGRTDTQQSTVDAPQRLRVDAGSGDVTVTRSDDSRVSIERRLTWSTSRPEITERRDGDTLVLESECGGLGILFINRCEVAYTLRVPASVELDIETGSGDVTVRDVEGRLGVRTGAGNIEASGLRGDAALRTGSGSLTASWNSVPRSVDARTGSGDLTVTVPPGQYDVRGGDRDSDISVTSTSGAPNVIEVDAGSGDIRVRHP